MSNLIYVGIDGEQIEAKGEVLNALLEAQSEAQKIYDDFEKQIMEKQALRESALAKLAALGLTEEEIGAL
jgi:hypothetical protein